MTLYFFLTPGGYYGLCGVKPNERDLIRIDSLYGSAMAGTIVFHGFDHPGGGFPDIAPGECIPVTLTPQPAAAKKRKGKKGKA